MPEIESKETANRDQKLQDAWDSFKDFIRIHDPDHYDVMLLSNSENAFMSSCQRYGLPGHILWSFRHADIFDIMRHSATLYIQKMPLKILTEVLHKKVLPGENIPAFAIGGRAEVLSVSEYGLAFIRVKDTAGLWTVAFVCTDCLGEINSKIRMLDLKDE